MKMKKLLVIFVMAPLCIAPASSRLLAGEANMLEIELNSISVTGKGCRIGFVMRNGLASAIDSLSFELVLFNKKGSISSILGLKAGALPVGKTRVKRFKMKSCRDISRILINDITHCKGEDLSPKVCLKALASKNRTDIQFGL